MQTTITSPNERTEDAGPREGPVPLIGPAFRTLPHNIEAEKALLGAILVNNSGLREGDRGSRSRSFRAGPARARLRGLPPVDRTRADRGPRDPQALFRGGRLSRGDGRPGLSGGAGGLGRDHLQCRRVRTHHPRSPPQARADRDRHGRGRSRLRRRGPTSPPATRSNWPRSPVRPGDQGRVRGWVPAVPNGGVERDQSGANGAQAGRRARRRVDRLRRPRHAARRVACVRPGHPRRPAVHGQDGTLDQHRLQRRLHVEPQ